MKAACPRLVIAGTGSGMGKTSLTLGLARLLARQGLRVQTFKVGPDFLDPTYLARASGRTCYNLDGWMTSREYVRWLFARATADADIALVEGVMGMFDGASPTALEGSTAEIAWWLNAPVVLVAGAHGVARSLAATVKGFAEFEPRVRVAGVIANQGGSERHRAWLAESLAAAATAPLAGTVPRGSLPALPSRHLGLVAADQANLSDAVLDRLADACEQFLDVRLLVDLARNDSHGVGESSCAGAAGEGEPHDRHGSLPGERWFKTPYPSPPTPLPQGERGELVFPASEPQGERGELTQSFESSSSRKVRLGIARDEAFHFYYADNLEALAEHGAEWVPFSPLADRRLPDDLDGLYFGGGYPELHAARLAENASMLAAVKDFAASGRAVYAECGGLMYLGRGLTALDGTRHAMASVLPIETAMLGKLRVLGYAEVAWAGDCLWGPAGETVRGHEFHYSQITADDGQREGWAPAGTVMRRRSAPTCEGFCRASTLAGYVHLHWASRPDAVRHFLSRCGARS